MKKVLILMAVLTVIALAIPAMAMPTSTDPLYEYWDYQWFTGFDLTALTPEGKLATNNTTGNDGWVAPTMGTGTNLSGDIVNDPLALSGRNVYQNGPGGSTTIGFANSRHMMGLSSNPNDTGFKEGYVEYWMYDPRGTGTTVDTDSRGWVGSPAFNPASTVNSGSYTWGATLGDSRLDGKTYWVFAGGSSFLAATGSGGTTGAGGMVITAVANQARVRTMGWHQVNLYWNFTNTTGRMEMYVDDMNSPCVVADIVSSGSRWNNLKGGVSDLYIGSTQGVVTNAGLIDEVSFYGKTPYPNSPEPSGLMALGAGAFGLIGLIRRRK